MYKYCTNCKKSYDFKIKTISDLDNMICPVCNCKVYKNSESPADPVESNRAANSIAKGFSLLMTVNYFYYIVLSLAGIAFYFFRLEKPLFIVTGISLVSFLIQLIFGFNTFHTGLIFLPLGGILGFLIFKTIAGACLGIMIVFLIRHLFRSLFYKLIGKLIHLGSK